MAEEYELEIAPKPATPEPPASEPADLPPLPAVETTGEDTSEESTSEVSKEESPDLGVVQKDRQDPPAPVDGEEIPEPAPTVPPQLAEPVAPDFDELRETLKHGLERLIQAFDDKIAFDAHKERQIDALHRELQEHKQGLLAEATRPLLSGLVRLHDNLGRMAIDLRGRDPEELTPARAAQMLEEFQDDVEIVLEENGVDVFTEPGERFEPRRQSAQRTIETEDAAQVGQIARRLRPGFERDGQLLQKERVEVFAATPASAQPAHQKP